MYLGCMYRRERRSLHKKPSNYTTRSVAASQDYFVFMPLHCAMHAYRLHNCMRYTASRSFEPAYASQKGTP